MQGPCKKGERKEPFFFVLFMSKFRNVLLLTLFSLVEPNMGWVVKQIIRACILQWRQLEIIKIKSFVGDFFLLGWRGLHHGFNIKMVTLILLCAHMEEIRNLDLLKAFGYIERVVKSEKTYVTAYVRNKFWATILCKYNGLHKCVPR